MKEESYMKVLELKTFDEIQKDIRNHHKNHYKKIISDIDSTNTLEQLKDVLIDYIEEFKLEQD
jgi:hypothetical protein